MRSPPGFLLNFALLVVIPSTSFPTESLFKRQHSFGDGPLIDGSAETVTGSSTVNCAAKPIWPWSMICNETDLGLAYDCPANDIGCANCKSRSVLIGNVSMECLICPGASKKLSTYHNPFDGCSDPVAGMVYGTNVVHDGGPAHGSNTYTTSPDSVCKKCPDQL